MTNRLPRPPRHLGSREERELTSIRAALADDVMRRSLRAVAREVGMRPSGLKNFLAGTVPYAPTLAKVRAWYQRWRDGAGWSVEDVDQLIRRLLRWLPDPEAGIPDVLDSIARAHYAACVGLPPWFAGVMSRHSSPSGTAPT